MPFRSPLRVEALPALDRWRVLEPLVYVTSWGQEITVPAGFETDLASIPRTFRRVFSVNGLHRPAAVVHDYLYAYRLGDRATADQIFLEAMAACGVPTFERHTMWTAVRLGGWLYWRSS